MVCSGIAPADIQPAPKTPNISSQTSLMLHVEPLCNAKNYSNKKSKEKRAEKGASSKISLNW